MRERATGQRGESMVDRHVRMPAALFKDIEKQARLNRRSINLEMINRLRWSLQAEQLRRVVVDAVTEAFERRAS